MFCCQGDFEDNRESRGSLGLFFDMNRNRADVEPGVVALLDS